MSTIPAASPEIAPICQRRVDGSLTLGSGHELHAGSFAGIDVRTVAD
jgi:hypothetical protein